MTLLCRICLEPTVEPRVTLCGHAFCSDHIEQWFQSEQQAERPPSCPMCRTAVNPDHEVITVFDMGIHGNSPAEPISDSTDPEEEKKGVRDTVNGLLEKWDRLLIDRASLKKQVAELEDERHQLKAQVAMLQEENAALRSQPKDEISPAAQTMPDGPQMPLLASVETSAPSCSVHHISQEDGKESMSWLNSSILSDVHDNAIHGVAAHHSRNIIATASWDKTCIIYDVDNQVAMRTLTGHDNGLYSVEFSRVNQALLGTVSSDLTCRIWTIDGVESQVLCSHEDEVNNISFHWQRNVVATASDDETARVWDIELGTPVSRFAGHTKEVYDVCFVPNSDLLVSVSFDWTIMFWDWRTPARTIHVLQGHLDDVIGVDVSVTGNVLATGSDDMTCRIWDIRQLKQVHCLQDHSGEVKKVRFSPCGKRLVTTSGDRTAKIWDTDTFKCEYTAEGHHDHVFDAAWSSRCEYLVTASHDSTCRVWKPTLAQR